MTPAALRQTRESLGLTQEELAAHIGRSRTAVNRYENGQAPIPRVVEIAVQALVSSATPRSVV